jgi:opine dehydrogenase
MKKICVIGAGNSGFAMAAHLSSEGYSVCLWNRTYENIKTLVSDKKIACSGYINGEFILDLVTDNLKSALDYSDLILITTPANSHKDLARKFADKLSADKTIILNPGRTFGALEFQNELTKHGFRDNIELAETQTIIYTCRKESDTSVNIITMKKNVLISALKQGNEQKILNGLPDCLSKFLKPSPSMILTSLGNVGMILHCAPVLLNTGWIENPFLNFYYYSQGISPSIAKFLENLDKERIEVSKKLGYEVESTKEWINRSYEIDGKDLYDALTHNPSYKTIEAPVSLNHRYIFEDVSCGLVPLESVGKQLGLEMRFTSLIIDLATAIINYDFRKNGRNLENMDILSLFQGNTGE